MVMMGEMWGQLGSVIASVMFVSAMFQNYFPYELSRGIEKYCHKFLSLFYPYIKITFDEYPSDGYERCKAFAAIERYLAANSSATAKRLKANLVKNSKSLVLSMDDYEEISEKYEGAKLWWTSKKFHPTSQSISFYPREDEKRYYTLTFHKKHRDVITKAYLRHVLDEGKAIAVRGRQRKLFTNNNSESWYGYRKNMWSHVVFDHPATFETWALDPKKKQDIISDLLTFSKAKDYYAKVGKAWKRGYLLYGPPGTGKSTMVAAMANLLEYDVYDLELTAVKDNAELRKLLIGTMSKSIIVIEDIDCSLDLTGQRKSKNEKDEKKEVNDAEDVKKAKEASESKTSQVTLSGLLNFIDGIWSACGGERIIVFTTNHVEKLDPALIRRGRMDKHIELSYCCFEAFKVLARNYLDLESHPLFATISKLLDETNMTPADVAENLMPKSAEEGSETCLENLIKALEAAKEEARMKAVEEEKLLKAEKEDKLKA
ncbi:hypothetical protein RJ639_012652 [Escallonia herrerae]|uniref:AAA+ ATPase domain-containing protein n=1 Tax=Escallonia herrerae TaxID=1293975 RepID=A0AA88VJU9_9ASTE|nr:hypothetical protein RJ639_012652 [Escallonia herrerae]